MNKVYEKKELKDEQLEQVTGGTHNEGRPNPDAFPFLMPIEDVFSITGRGTDGRITTRNPNLEGSVSEDKI